MSAPTVFHPHGDGFFEARQARLVRSLRLMMAALLSMVVLISFTPFAVATLTQDYGQNDGNVLNQVGYLTAAGLAIAAIGSLVERRRLLYFVQWQWLVLVAILFISMMHAPDPGSAMRGILLTGIAMSIAASLVILPQTESDFRLAMTIAVLAVLGASYAGLIALPNAAMHQEFDAEGHTWLWRGIYSHKNIAGPVMAAFAIFGIYVMRSGHVIIGFLIAIASAIFVIKTGSKTTTGFLPLAVMVVAMRRIFGSTALVILGYLTSVLGIATLAIGSAFSPRIMSVTKHLIADTTFTGRDDIWRFAVKLFPEGLFGSYGFFGFWGTLVTVQQEEDKSAKWDVRYIVNGHTNFIDTVLYFGKAQAAVVLFILLLLPAFHYRRACRNPENRLLADFFMMVVTLMGMISSLEAFFFDRAQTIWLILFLAVFGLSCLSKRDGRYWDDKTA